MNEIILSTQKLCKTFSSQGNQQHILKNLDLNIYRGDFTVIMGPSGLGNQHYYMLYLEWINQPLEQFNFQIKSFLI